MKILGFSAYFHDSAAALIIDDQVVAAVEEERFNRQKHTRAFPRQAIQYCLQEGNIEAAQLDAIAFFLGGSPIIWRAAGQVLLNVARWARATPHAITNRLRWAWQNPGRLQSRHRDTGPHPASVVLWAQMLRRELNLPKGQGPQLVGVDHHNAHVGAAYLASGLEEAAVLIVDGRGEWTTTTLANGRNGAGQTLQTITLPHSLAYLYGVITGFLGFRMLSDEGKVMGLSSYGQPKYDDAFRHFLEITPAGLFRLDTRYIDFATALACNDFPPALSELLGPPRQAGTPLEDRHAHIARSLQDRFESGMLALSQALANQVQADLLCLAGGAGLNSVGNGRLAREGGWSQIFVPPAPGDAGTALGAAAWQARQTTGSPALQRPSPYLGPAFTAESCRQALLAADIPFRRADDVPALAARLLSEGHVLGWFQGRLEFGPRALGNRSILADPRTEAMRDRVNTLKGRELWRPLAPSILAEKQADWFIEPGDSPYMSFVKTVRPEKAAEIAACVHVDGTARLQSVHRSLNPRYWSLIDHFARLTGIPCLLNTSFNRRGEPIVCTPAQAVASFQAMQLDYLILGDFVAGPYLAISRSAQ